MFNVDKDLLVFLTMLVPKRECIVGHVKFDCVVKRGEVLVESVARLLGVSISARPLLEVLQLCFDTGISALTGSIQRHVDGRGGHQELDTPLNGAQTPRGQRLATRRLDRQRLGKGDSLHIPRTQWHRRDFHEARDKADTPQSHCRCGRHGRVTRGYRAGVW